MWVLVRVALASAAVYWFLSGKDLGRLWEVMLQLELWALGAAVGLFLVSQLVFVQRWRLLLWVQGVSIGTWVAIRLHFLGLFYNNFLPSSVGGDFLRAWYVTKHTDKRFAAALSVFVDRAVGLAGLFLMAAVAYLFLPAEGATGQVSVPDAGGAGRWLWSHRAGIGIGLGAAVLVAAVLVAIPRTRRILREVVSSLAGRAGRLLVKVHEAAVLYWRKPWAIGAGLVLTFFCQGIFITGLWLAGRSLGITAPMKYYFVFIPVSWLIGALPISIGGLGFMEKGVESMFRVMAGVPAELAAAVALCQRLVLVISSLPGVVVHLAGAHLPKEFFIDYDKSVT